jgi:hypothetical protein
VSSSAGRAKRDRERARQEKQAIKRDRKEALALAGPDEPDSDLPKRPQEEVLADLDKLHQRFADEQIDFDDFESAKRDLMAQLDI